MGSSNSDLCGWIGKLKRSVHKNCNGMFMHWNTDIIILSKFNCWHTFLSFFSPNPSLKSTLAINRGLRMAHWNI